MDDNTRVIKMQLKGTAYSFTPVTAGQKTALALADREDGSQEIFNITRRILRKAAGPEQWAEIMGRLADGVLTDKDVTKLVTRLVARQKDDAGDQATNDDE